MCNRDIFEVLRIFRGENGVELTVLFFFTQIKKEKADFFSRRFQEKNKADKVMPIAPKGALQL